MTQALLDIKNLKIAYNGRGKAQQVLHGISLKVEAGHSVGIVGESGSGKSQTALSVLRLLEGKPGIIGGEINFNGLNLASLSESDMQKIRGHKISIIFQDAKAALIPYMAIKEQVLDTYKSLGGGRTKKQIVEEASGLLKEMNFSDPGKVLSSYPGQLSGGECQRAYIMLSLLGHPQLLIADEPTSSLDPVTSYKLVDLLKDICDKRNIAFVLISHDLAEIVRVTDFVYVFFNGRVVEEFPTSWIHNNTEPVHPYSRFLFSMYKGEAFAALKNGKQISGITEAENSTDEDSQAGCIYAHRCAWKNELPDAVIEKCETVHPNLQNYRKPGRVACWGAEFKSGRNAED